MIGITISQDALRILDDEISVGGIERDERDRYSWEEQQVRFNGRAGRLKFVGEDNGVAYLKWDKEQERGKGIFLGNAKNFASDYEIVDGKLIDKKIRRGMQ